MHRFTSRRKNHAFHDVCPSVSPAVDYANNKGLSEPQTVHVITGTIYIKKNGQQEFVVLKNKTLFIESSVVRVQNMKNARKRSTKVSRHKKNCKPLVYKFLESNALHTQVLCMDNSCKRWKELAAKTMLGAEEKYLIGKGVS